MSYNEAYQHIVRKIYQKYNPDKTDDVPSLFEKYRGKEKDLTEMICKKYNVSDSEVDEIKSEYHELFTTPPRILSTRSVWIMVIAAIFIVVVCWLYSANRNNTQMENANAAVIDENGTSASPINEDKNAPTIKPFLNFEDLKQLTEVKAASNVVLEFLNEKSNDWEFKGEDNENLIWSKGLETQGQMITYFKEHGIWEYVFFQNDNWSVINQTISDESFELNSEQRDENGDTKTYRKGEFVVQTVQVKLSGAKMPWGYKFLIMKNGQGMAQSQNSNTDNSNIEHEVKERYFVVSEKAYFHDLPNPDSKRKAYLIKGEFLDTDKEENGFVYTEFKNAKGIITKGWLDLKDLEWTTNCDL